MLVSTADSPDGFKEAMRRYASGVTLVTAHSAEGDPIGMTATAFSSVSVEPRLVLICVHSDTRTFERLLRSGYFGVNLLAADAQEVSHYCSRPGGSKALPAEWLEHQPKWTAPALKGSLAFLDCDIYRYFPAGSHYMVVGRVRGVGLADQAGDERAGQAGPLVYFQGSYRELRPTVSAAVLGSGSIGSAADPAQPVSAMKGSAL